MPITPSSSQLTTVMLIHENALIPTGGTEQSAAYDIYSAKIIILPPSLTTKVNTGINIHFAQGNFGFVTI
eukprot:10446907-Ditylum_brightwellii.AAC.1